MNRSQPGARLDGLLKLVVADDSPIILDVVREMFEAVGAEVHTVDSAIGLSGTLRRVNPDVVMLDFNMPIRGDDALKVVRRICPKATVVLFSDDPNCAQYARMMGVPWVGKNRPDTVVSAVLAEARRDMERRGR